MGKKYKPSIKKKSSLRKKEPAANSPTPTPPLTAHADPMEPSAGILPRCFHHCPPCSAVNNSPLKRRSPSLSSSLMKKRVFDPMKPSVDILLECCYCQPCSAVNNPPLKRHSSFVSFKNLLFDSSPPVPTQTVHADPMEPSAAKILPR